MKEKTKIANALQDLFAKGKPTQFSSKELYTTAHKHGLTYARIKEVFMADKFSVGRGKYDIRQMLDDSYSPSTPKPASQIFPAKKAIIDPPAHTVPAADQLKLISISNNDIFIPDIDETFVPWGEYKNIIKIIESQMFFPTFISGMSGNGKSLMVEQACAKLGREYVRVQISPETDADSLLGGFRLIDGQMVFHKGPVVKAMERGCILLIDEIDRGSNKILCLQGVLEGKPILIPQIGEMIRPTLGFNVIASANTKGRGSDDGRYSAATIIDDAFMERFVANIDQPYPNFKIEHDIVMKHMSAYEVDDVEFVDKLVAWSSVIRKTYNDEAIDELISTRRLCFIMKAYSIFQDRLASIEKCISRFEVETREAFLDLYTKIDSGSIKPNEADLNAGF